MSSRKHAKSAKPAPTTQSSPAEPAAQGMGWRRYLIPLALFLAGYATFAVPSDWFARLFGQ